VTRGAWAGMLRRDERGSIAPAIPIIAFMLLVLAGLGIDGSRQLNARGEATAYAEEAARAGAQGIDIGADELTLNDSLVAQRVQQYCHRIEQLSAVKTCELLDIEQVSDADPRRLVVHTEVTLQTNATLLGLIGIRTLNAGADAKARPYEGVDSATD
jgi:hypothetical protein